jgi:NAD(P)-dependent dehydrogenase (short-subunit alcohol dehydrogenase family)
MTKALACAWAKDNVQVNAILPGWIDTPLTQAARKVILRKGDCTAAINARFVAEPGPAQRTSALVRSSPLDYGGLRGGC